MNKRIEITPNMMRSMRGKSLPTCQFQLNCANKHNLFKGVPRIIHLCTLCIKNARNIRFSRTGRIQGIKYEEDYYVPLLDNFKTENFNIDDHANMENLMREL